MERFLSIPENGKEFRISSITLQRGGFCFAREAIPFDIEMDQKRFCMDEGETGAPA
jgi:hypothetical protein